MAKTKTAEPVPEKRSWLVPFKHESTAVQFVNTFRDRLMERLEKYHELDPEGKIAATEELLASMWLYGEELRKVGPCSLSPVETLFGFMGWLTCRPAVLSVGSSVDAAPVVKLIERFMEAQGWKSIKCRDHWEAYLVPVPVTLSDEPRCKSAV